jgi:hypothetical protein
MSIEANQNLVVITGGVQQKNAYAAHDRQVSQMSSGLKTSRPVNRSPGLLLEENSGPDTTSISRSGIVALESAQNVNDESVIRDKDSAGEALAYSTSQIAEYPERAVEVQANQTPQQLIALVTDQ